MIVQDRVDFLKKNMYFTFCGIKFDLYRTDYIRIYNNASKSICIFTTTLDRLDEVPEEILKEEISSEQLIKLNKDDFKLKSSFAVCIKLGKFIEKPEGGISAKVTYK
jgi:hypothetical protein